jgi:alpha-amylase
MSAVCFYFQVHQPYRVQQISPFATGDDVDYFLDVVDERHDNHKILDKVSEKCYIPTNALLLELLELHPEFCFSFSFSGVFLEQIERWRPDVLESFQRLVATGRVEVLAETYYHSLSFLFSQAEFKAQVAKHQQTVERLFGTTPQVFRNTELIYNNELASVVESMGYAGILTEGADHILKGQTSPNFLYSPVNTNKIKLFLKNYQLSDDIAFRFSAQDWSEFPLTADKFASWISNVNGAGEIVNLFMDYESFGEHQWESSGIFEFLRHLPWQVFDQHPDNYFITPTKAAAELQSYGYIDIHNYISWADSERDLSAWLSNELQEDALSKIYQLESRIILLGNEELIESWRRLQTSDHFYYMCTKYFEDGNVHKYFSPYETPYQAFIYYMNAVRNLLFRLEREEVKLTARQELEMKVYEQIILD